MTIDPGPDIRSARKVGHFIDGKTQVAIRKVKSGGSCGALVSSDIELRQVRSASEKRLQDSTGNVPARRDSEYVLVGKDNDRIAFSTALLKVADTGLEHPRISCRIADAAHFPEAVRTFRQRIPHLRQPVAETRWLEDCDRLAKQHRASNRGQRYKP